MTSETTEFADLPATLMAERHGAIAVLRLNRAQKRNALNDPMVAGIETFFSTLPEDIRAVVLCGNGDNFSAGLDLTELVDRGTAAGVAHSRSWHRAFDRIEFGSVPVVAVLQGAVVGGGLELAAAAHVRVAERNAFYALPEGSRGIYIGGGGSVRLPPLIGTARMMDMMLTARTLSAEEGQTIGLSQYLVDDGEGFAKGMELAHRIAGNAPFTNFAVMHLLPRIARSDPAAGYVTEALAAAIAQGDEEAKARLKAFLEKRAHNAIVCNATARGQARARRCRGRAARRWRHPDALAACAAGLSAHADRTTCPLDQSRTGLCISRLARRRRRLAHDELRADAHGSPRPRGGAAAARAKRRAPGRDSLRQRYRARASRPCRHACRHSLCPDLSCLLGPVAGFLQA